MTTKIHTLARWFSFLWAIAAYAYLITAPSYGTKSSTSAGDVVTGTATLLEVNGTRVLYILAVPLLAATLALLPMPRASRRWATGAAAFIVAAFSVLGAWTVGLFFMPTAIALLIAAAADSSPPAPAT